MPSVAATKPYIAPTPSSNAAPKATEAKKETPKKSGPSIEREKDTFERAGVRTAYANQPKEAAGGDTKVGEIASWIQKTDEASLTKESAAALKRSPVEYWNMMLALKEQHPPSYQKATHALANVIKEGGFTDLSNAHRAIGKIYDRRPHLLPSVLQDITNASPMAGAKASAALGSLMSGHSWNRNDLALTKAAAKLKGPGKEAVQTAIASHVAKRENVKNLNIEGAAWLVELEADPRAYVKNMARLADTDTKAYKKELEQFKKFGMRTNLSGGAYAVFDQLKSSKIPGANIVKADLLKTLEGRYKKLKKHNTIAYQEARGAQAQAMAHIMDDPKLVDFMMSSKGRRQQFKSVMNTMVESGGRRGRKTARKLVKYTAQAAAKALKGGSQADIEKHARRMGVVVRTTMDALKAHAPGEGHAKAILGVMGNVLSSLTPAGGTAAKIAKILASHAYGKALDAALDRPAGEDPFKSRMLGVAGAIFHAVHDPYGRISEQPETSKERMELERKLNLFDRYINEGYTENHT